MDSTQLEEVLRRVEQSLDEKDTKLIRAVFESYVYVADLVEDKNTSIRRLRKLFFGARTEEDRVGRGAPQPRSQTRVRSMASGQTPNWRMANRTQTSPTKRIRRLSAKVTGATAPMLTMAPERIDVRHASLSARRPVSRLR